jgi:hypothetical protein
MLTQMTRHQKLARKGQWDLPGTSSIPADGFPYEDTGLPVV